MSARLTATDAESLERVAGHIHDAWFDVERIRREGDVVSISLALRPVQPRRRFRPARMELPEFDRRPSSATWTFLDIDDPAQIRTYQLTDLEYQPPRLTLEADRSSRSSSRSRSWTSSAS